MTKPLEACTTQYEVMKWLIDRRQPTGITLVADMQLAINCAAVIARREALTFGGFKPGDKVQKVKGHRFNGTVIGGGVTLAGKQVIITELDAGENAEGLLHIHAPEQMAAQDERKG